MTFGPPTLATGKVCYLEIPAVDVGRAIAFYAAAFGAEELGERFTAPGGTIIHAELGIGDSVVMVTEGDGEGGGGSALLCTYWPDVDAAWARAIAAKIATRGAGAG